MYILQLHHVATNSKHKTLSTVPFS